MGSTGLGRLSAGLQRHLGAALSRVQGETAMFVLAAAVGLATGLLAVALIGLIALVQDVAFGRLPPVATLLVVLPVGGLLVGVLVTYWMPEAAGGGVTQLMSAIALHGGRMRHTVWLAKLVASALSIGTGASGGREGPIVQIGGSVGSSLGQLLRLDDERMRTLIAAGAGAGIAASFNAPLSGIFFAVEIIVGGFRIRSLQTIVLTCVIASVTARELIGSEITYQLLRPPRFSDPRELPLYVLLGLAAAALGLAYSRGEHLVAEHALRTRLWPPLRSALGALGVGLIAIALPEVIGTGDHLPAGLGRVREPIEEMLNGGLGTGWQAAGTLLLLALGKLAATCLTIGTGNSAGSFAPAVFLGAALGGAFGHVAQTILPGGQGIQPGGFALVGVAAVLGSSVRAPLTGILLAFELTNDYGMVLPLMLATGISTLVADRIDRDSIYTLPLRRRGIVYAEPEDVDIMQTVRVGEIMTARPDTVPADLPLPRLIDAFSATGHHGFPVVDGDRLVGVVTLADLGRPGADNLGGVELTAADLCTRQPVTVTPSDPVFRALRRMAALDVGRLPVVADQDRRRLVGLVRRADIVKAYQRALTRSLGVQQRRQSSRLRDLAGAQFVELVVDAEAPAGGRAVRDVAWPQRTILTSVRRDGELIMPHGDTVLEPGDEVVVLTGQDAVGQVRGLIAGLEEPTGGG